MVKYFFVSVLAVLIMTAGVIAQDVAAIGKSAPGFSLRDVDGKMHNLDDFKGKYVVLEWINFDCPFVVKHYSGENMQNLQREYIEKGIVWLAICSSAPGKQGHFDNDEIKKRIKDSKSAMTAYLIDEIGIVGKLYDARTTPHMYIINPDGKLVYQGGIDDKKSTDKADIPNSKNFVKAALDELLLGKEVSTPTSQPYGCSVKYSN
ncbi:MAG: thioredoxin family protein [Candidatus Kapabacteria bacterium]|nr:thioredoxin family protein [Ignavibacteriota bacterium]MCW5883765.1 thioredoxin family protein [Candidatus Kapabacteria bacterium]